MVQSQFSLAWESYNSSICKGFSALQQNGEFVDMTLAADGHYVKVHQVLMALASPYLKELISSAPCQHPVLFLNNVSHRTLSLLLVYIYTGEVHIPAESLTSFAEAAKSLHIKGLENITGNDGVTVKIADNMSQMEDSELCHVSGTRRMVVPASAGMEEIEIPAAARKILIKKENVLSVKNSSRITHVNLPSDTKDESMGDVVTEEDDMLRDSDDDFKNVDDSLDSKAINTTNTSDTPSSNLQFTVSIRGSLQIVLNRYIYNLHSNTQKTGVRRWRCVDYRNLKCKAFVITKGNVVLNRANLHNHPFHDKKILAKIEKKSVYSALEDVYSYKEREEAKLAENDASMDNDNDYSMLDDFRKELEKSSDKIN